MDKERGKAQAFRQEFYEGATRQQVIADVVSYLGEYRFEVDEHPYDMGLKDGRLTDPISGALMADLTQKAIDIRRQQGLGTNREEAELEGFQNLEGQIASIDPQDRDKTIVWFSPPGREEDGYGKYGFGYTGHFTDQGVEMTAIRLEDPSLVDFNEASQALWGENYENPEGFLRSPRVIDVEEQAVKEFIRGNFEIPDKQKRVIFEKSLRSMEGVILDFSDIVLHGTEEQKHTGFHTVENLSLELIERYKLEGQEGVVFVEEVQLPDLKTAMQMDEYNKPAPTVNGSCGASGVESNNIFRNIMFTKNSSPLIDKRDFGFDYPGPCRMCERDVPCGPCKICESCNDKIDAGEMVD